MPAWIGGGDALAGDLAIEAQLVQQLAGGLAVVAAVQVAGAAGGPGAVQQPAGGAYHDMHPLLELADLRPVSLAAINCQGVYALVSPEGGDCL